MNLLSNYASSNYYSQFGEDGILEEILKRIEKHVSLDGWCSEFGAWDGVHLSNTCHLIRNKNYKAVLVEGNISRVKELNKNLPSNDVIKVCRFVSFDGKNSLEHIYAETPIPHNFDFLSIDVDGVDYHIFESLQNYRPKIVCIEFNPSIPNSVDYVQSKDMRIKHGNSAKALTRLAHQKGYSLVSSTQCNLFFVDSTLSNFVVEAEPTLNDLNPDGISETIIFSGYDGSILSNKKEITLIWHGVPVPIAEKLQFFPKFMRKYKGDYGFLRNLFFIFYVAYRLPKQILKNRQMALDKFKAELRGLLRLK
jgi:hypothetical protein